MFCIVLLSCWMDLDRCDERSVSSKKRHGKRDSMCPSNAFHNRTLEKETAPAGSGGGTEGFPTRKPIILSNKLGFAAFPDFSAALGSAFGSFPSTSSSGSGCSGLSGTRSCSGCSSSTCGFGSGSLCSSVLGASFLSSTFSGAACGFTGSGSKGSAGFRGSRGSAIVASCGVSETSSGRKVGRCPSWLPAAPEGGSVSVGTIALASDTVAGGSLVAVRMLGTKAEETRAFLDILILSYTHFTSNKKGWFVLHIHPFLHKGML